jgi:dihydrodiol dehydrogenase / D-xylose 1-dehydrogenase (NADP)
MKKIKWAIMGTGTIANSFAKGLAFLEDAELYAVASRSIEKASEFGEMYGSKKCYGSYEEVVKDKEVDVVYIATPNNVHKENIILCLNNGKAVLCEKPFTINVKETEEVIKLAREKKLFLMEGMWTRFFPIMKKVQEWINEGNIGKVRMVTADFGFRREGKPEERKVSLKRGGGALMDVGIYPISFTSWIFKKDPVDIKGVTSLYETGVDEQSAMILKYNGGQMALLACAINTPIPQEAKIIGNKGTILIPGFSKATSATLSVVGEEPITVNIPIEGNGYNYEAAAVMECIRKCELECSVISLDESLSIMKTMDELRNQYGIVFPSENIVS